MINARLVSTFLCAASFVACGKVTVPANDGDVDVVDLIDADTTDAADCVPADPAIEICDNGIDEDCNDLIDDPAICDGSALLEVVKDPSGSALRPPDVAIHVRPAPGVTGTLECRTGKLLPAGTLNESFEACNPTEFTPPLNPVNTGDGLYRTEVRLVHPDGVRSGAIAVSYYLHASLLGAAPCSLSVTPQALFTKALEDLDTSTTDTSPTLVFDPDAAVGAPGFAQIANPFVRVNFTPRDSRAFGFGPNANEFFRGRTDGEMKVLSLRRRFLFNQDKSLLLIDRRYASRRGSAFNSGCAALNHVSSEGGGRREIVSCDAVVLNREGAGVCLGVAGTTITSLFSPRASQVSQLVSTALLEIPLNDDVDNSMWRKLGAVHSPTPANIADRVSCSSSPDTCSFNGWSGRFGSRHFSPKCFGDENCAQALDAQNLTSTGPFSALYLPDDEFFSFE